MTTSLRSKWAAGKAVRAGLAEGGRISESIRNRRRPKLVLGLGYFGYCLLLTGGVTLPLVDESGRFLDVVWLFISFLLIASATVRTIRRRRDYATSLRRLIRGGVICVQCPSCQKRDET